MTLITTLKIRLWRENYVRALVAIIAVVLAFALSIGVRADSPKVWARGFTWAESKGTATASLSLYYLDQNESHLVGVLSYENRGSVEKVARPTVIAGVVAPDGLFYPNISLAVRREMDSEWENVESAPIKGRHTKVKVDAGKTNWKLSVILDPFKSLIGKYKFGKLVLNTGETSEFQLKYLLPPEKEE